ncbi:BH3-interacting domain death agonist [Trichinella pseudospiralis]
MRFTTSLLPQMACQWCSIVFLLTEGDRMQNATVGDGDVEAINEVVINYAMHCLCDLEISFRCVIRVIIVDPSDQLNNRQRLVCLANCTG